MAIDLPTLYQQILACTTLANSRDALLNGILAMLDGEDDNSGHATAVAKSLRSLVPHPDDENRQISWIALLGEALIRNTSHVAVDPRHPGYATAHRMLTETPELDKAAHIAQLEEALAGASKEAAAYQRAIADESESHAVTKGELDALKQEHRARINVLAGGKGEA